MRHDAKLHRKVDVLKLRGLGERWRGARPKCTMPVVTTPTEDDEMDMEVEAGEDEPEWRLAEDPGEESEDDWGDEDGENNDDIGEIAEGEQLSEIIEGFGILGIDTEDIEEE
ncbi:hypothetical protein B0H14DRAFT_3428068 [Mycena olivaceomarginata]|nr:hypothetical protein B0H14DRAFT_3428068 [Mycena olivaceomarginata]